jgi:hypothetical protein
VEYVNATVPASSIAEHAAPANQYPRCGKHTLPATVGISQASPGTTFFRSPAQANGSAATAKPR